MALNYLSVVIVTKNRAIELTHCIGSLLSNNVLPDEIIVIDNNSIDSTKQLILGLKLNSLIPIKYVNYNGIGYPKIYNKGIKESKHEWVVFIDDDCVASNSWIREINSSIKNNFEADVILGWCGTYYPQNIYSLATLALDNEWKRRALRGNRVHNFEVLDNKNIAYRKKFLEKNNLEYDENRIKHQHGAAEDCDLGIQIQEKNGRAVCNKNMIVWHKDPQDLMWLFKKSISSWNAYQSLSMKWDLDSRSKLNLPPKSTNLLIDENAKKYKLSMVEKTKLTVVIKLVLLLGRILQLVNMEWIHSKEQ